MVDVVNPQEHREHQGVGRDEHHHEGDGEEDLAAGELVTASPYPAGFPTMTANAIPENE